MDSDQPGHLFMMYETRKKQALIHQLLLIMVMELVFEKERMTEIHDRCNPHECKFRKHKENIHII